MNRAMFLSELRMGLSGLPHSEIEETVADYEAHFSEGIAAGRSEAAIANALANRTDLIQSRKQMEQTDISMKYLRNQQLPSIDVTGNYNVQGVAGTQFQFDRNSAAFPPPILSQSQRSFTDALHDVFANDFKTWSVTLNVSYPLGTSAAEAGLAQARLQR